MQLVHINAMVHVKGLVQAHVWLQVNVINAQIFAKVVVMEVAMGRVNPPQKVKIH